MEYPLAHSIHYDNDSEKKASLYVVKSTHSDQGLERSKGTKLKVMDSY